jgi:hypothetical protein
MTASSRAAPSATCGTADVAGFALCLCVSTIVYGWIGVGANAVTGVTDAIEYVLLADFYKSTFHGLVNPEAAQFYHYSRFPPLFPLFLGALGAGSDAQPLAKQLTAALAVGATLVVWCWARRAAGSTLAATVIALALALNPGFFLLCLNPMSEPLAMILAWCALLAASRARTEGSGYWLAALCIGLACLARSICVALVAAWLLWLLRERVPWRTVAAAVLLAAAPLALWMLHLAGTAGAESYARALDPGWMLAQLGGWPDALYLQPWRMFRGLVGSLQPGNAGAATVFCVPVVLLALAGWIDRLRRNRLDAWFLPLFLGLRMVWPEVTDIVRFVVFVLPLVVLCAIRGAQLLAERAGLTGKVVPGGAACLVALLLALASGTAVLRFVQRATLPVDAELAGEMRDAPYFLAGDDATAALGAEGTARIRQTAIAAAGLMGPEDCVYAVQPGLLRLQAKVRALPYPLELDPARPVLEQLGRCRFYFVNPGEYLTGRQSGYHLLAQIATIATPKLASSVLAGSQPVLVAALFERRDEEAALSPPPRD